MPLPGMRGPVRHGWVFITYVLGYALIRGLLALLRTDEQDIVGGLSVPQLLAILTALAAAWMALHLHRNPQAPVGSFESGVDETRDGARQDGRTRRAERRATKMRQPGQSRRGRRRR